MFVGIYANRYGYMPEGAKISITEAKYNAATVSKIPRLIFIEIENALLPAVSPDSESANAKHALSEFKGRLRTNHIVKSFDGPQDLAAKVGASVGRELLIKQRDDSFERRLSVADMMRFQDYTDEAIRSYLSRLEDEISDYLLDTSVFQDLDQPLIQLTGSFSFNSVVHHVSALPSSFRVKHPSERSVHRGFIDLGAALRHFDSRVLAQVRHD